MLTVYILAAIVGGILVLASALLGGEHDTHFGGDAHFGDTDFHNIGGDDGIHSDIYLPFLSLRFWTYFAACMGVTGLLLTNFTNYSSPVVAIAALGTGLVAGYAVTFVMKAINQRESDSGIKEDHLVGKEARVLVGINSASEGKIRLDVKGELVDMTAFTSEANALLPGDRALVVSIENGKANVVSLTAMLEETQK
jgi:membrane protein implicated in regulation of membrane protease activity